MIELNYLKQLKFGLILFGFILSIIFFQNYIFKDYFNRTENLEKQIKDLHGTNEIKEMNLKSTENEYNNYKMIVDDIKIKQSEMEKYKINVETKSLEIKDFFELFNKVHIGVFSLIVDKIEEDTKYQNVLNTTLRLESALNELDKETLDSLKIIILEAYKEELEKYKNDLSMLEIKIEGETLIYKYLKK